MHVAVDCSLLAGWVTKKSPRTLVKTLHPSSSNSQLSDHPLSSLAHESCQGRQKQSSRFPAWVFQQRSRCPERCLPTPEARSSRALPSGEIHEHVAVEFPLGSIKTHELGDSQRPVEEVNKGRFADVVAGFAALGLVVNHSEIVHPKPLQHGEGTTNAASLMLLMFMAIVKLDVPLLGALSQRTLLSGPSPAKRGLFPCRR